ncbi:TIGR00297 family protein [Chamaesiphon sp. GL140_3_metabinner_50]|uniref:TIGR00297 family protein n=1 Tax=Chamaesiphon sp. GL140_3_metabinner_50 TaxID=2970812 RepID=UPI0025D10B9D|nr:TIGR00297 family protein [Chamaesiphon sp. GL140_3_metabinner_50]
MLSTIPNWLNEIGSNPWLVAIGLNSVLLILATIIPKKLLTPAGLINAWGLGVVVWGTLGWRGYGVVMFYFLVGSAVTRIGMAQKEAEGIAEKRGGARGPENVWGSAFAATICAIGVAAVKFGWLDAGRESYLLLGYVASFSTKLADTTASEVGKAYGKSTYLITTLKPVPRGTEGAISLEGTLAGIVGGILISLVAYSLGLITFTGVIICTIASFIATNLESVIGATLQSKIDWLSNELVNVINTIIGAVVAIAIAIWWH